jgi:predicted esterase
MSARSRLVLCAGLALCSVANAQTEIRLWPGTAPGSDSWSLPESVTRSPSGDRVFNERGIAGFVLKYRTLQQDPTAPRGPPPGMGGAGTRQELVIVNGNANPAPDDAALREVLELAVADAQAALELVRERASEWRVDPTRVGLIGFSAGGGVGIGAALARKSAASPDFLVSVYGPSLQDVNVPEHAPPLFIAVGATHFNVTNGCLALFAAWKAAGKPAELHVYDGIGGGFGMAKRGHPVDGWTERLHEWLIARELTRQINVVL